ncbi:Aste57867_21372 [Aphanomyces stellatus]|uniref:Spindle pole body component n=1 Tax=Aphanomyces stellatus TaxID=120398 RepID=A0A485LHD7_9STRA|nr:hypothetical protein As57867_021303 [Aphanomyces stellatus]VFT98044.1 Aste57867_21372 [Aphanomyces stellatus]
MSIPQWTLAWRSDVRQLLNLLQAQDASPASFAIDELQVDYYIRRLHAHSFLEPSNEGTSNVAQGVVRTLEFHHRDQHAARVAQILFGSNDVHTSRPLRISPKIAWLLLQLMESPLAITPDELIEIDQIRIEGESRKSLAFHEEEKARLVTRSLVDELKQLTMQDDWFQDGNDDGDEVWSDDDLLDSPKSPTRPSPSRVRFQVPIEAKESNSEAQEPPSTLVPEPEPRVFVEERYSANKPWLLYQGYVDALGQLKTPLHFLEKTILPEYHFVRDVLSVLLGSTSTSFEKTAANLALPFWSPVVYSCFQLTTALHHQTVSHISPSCLYATLTEWAEVATAVAFLRSAATYFGDFPASTLQGFAHSLHGYCHRLTSFVSSLTRKMFSDRSLSPTLIALLLEMRPWLEQMKWLRQVVMQVVQPCENIKMPSIRHLVATVLSSLYRLLEQYTLLGDCEHYSLVYDLFSRSITPYLERLNDFLDGKPMCLELGFYYNNWSAFEETLYTALKFPPSVDPPCFLREIQSLILEAHAYAAMNRQQCCSLLFRASSPRFQLQTVASSPWSQFYDHPIIPKGLTTIGMQTPARLEWKESESDSSSLPPLSFNVFISSKLVLPIKARVRACMEIGHDIVVVFKQKWKILDHLQTIRLFLLLQHSDSSNWFSEQLIQRVMSPWSRSKWCENYTVNTLFRESLTKVSMNDPYLRHVDLISIKVSTGQDVGTNNVTALNVLCFQYSAPEPLNVIFRSELIDKISRVSILLLQLQGVERSLITLKHTMRYRPSFGLIQSAVHKHLIDLASMLHFVKHVHEFFRQQTSADLWGEVSKQIENATLISHMNVALEESVQRMLENCFLLDKHKSMHAYLLQLMNQIIHYLACFEESLMDRRVQSGVFASDALTTQAAKFKAAHGTVMILLNSMVKSGSAPHLHELILQLNYNAVYSVD